MLQLVAKSVMEVREAPAAAQVRAERLAAQRVRLTRALFRAERTAPSCAEAHALRQSYLTLCCTLHAEQEVGPVRRVAATT